MIAGKLLLSIVLLSRSIFALHTCQPLTRSASSLILRSPISLRPSLSLRMSSESSSKGTKKAIVPEDEWKTVLTPNQFAVLRLKATEPPGFSERSPGELEFELKKNFGTKYPKEGEYECVACGTPLYQAVTKFDSGCGWPAFYEGLPGAVKELPDADGRRIEIVCNNCGSHLGHVFKGEKFPTPTDERHCVNGVCLRYNPEK